MHRLNDEIKKISLKKILLLVIVSFSALLILKVFNISIDSYWVNVIIILYFVYKLKNFKHEVSHEISNIFSDVSVKLILIIVFANIFFSYGMLYLANFLLSIPIFKDFLNFDFISKVSFVLAGGYFSKLVLAPISEELVFRGVFINKLRLFVPLSFAVLISSLLFGSVHSYGSMFSAVVFAVCMAILYLKTENIFVPMLAHFLNNLFAEIIFALDFNNLIFNDWNVMLVISILAIISLFIIISFIFKEWNILNNKEYIV